jgi:peptidoglycan/LPS O-acetylase OafA/YrhL
LTPPQEAARDEPDRHQIHRKRSPEGPLEGLRAYIPALDGLRGIAILSVIIWHCIPCCQTFFPGWAGVDLFFVLSGYLITGRLLDTVGQRGYVAGFYRNRVLRIWPLYYAVVVPFLLLIPYIRQISGADLTLYEQHPIGFFFFVQNWTFIRYGPLQDLSLGHLWTLAVEEQFYLVWPFVILFVRDPRRRIALFISVILIVLVTRYIYFTSHQSGDGPVHIFYNTFFRIDSLVAGSLLCQLHRLNIPIPKVWVTLLACAGLLTYPVVCTLAGDTSTLLPFNISGGFTLVAIAFACILHLALQPGHLVARLCEIRPLRWVGKISYGLYMIHMPVWIILGNKLFLSQGAAWAGHERLYYWIVALICILVSFLLSAISYRYYESFFLRLKSSKKPTLFKI